MKSQTNRHQTALCQRIRGGSLVWRFVSPALCVFTLCVGHCDAQEKYDYGLNWKRMNESGHQLYLLGLEDASHELNMVKAQIGGGEERELSGLKSEQRMAVCNLVDEHLRKYAKLANFGQAAVSRVMNKVYDDPANTFVPYWGCFRIAIMKLEGDSEDVIAKYLEILRKLGEQTP